MASPLPTSPPQLSGGMLSLEAPMMVALDHLPLLTPVPQHTCVTQYVNVPKYSKGNEESVQKNLD